MKDNLRVLALVLAGGKGERLYPLTKFRAKPAVPFAGKYRIIDFVLSNLVNSRIFSIYILTQYGAQSLADHIEQGWQFGPALRGRDFFISLAPAQMRTGEHWYRGTADAVFQNLYLVANFDADVVLIFGADHVYKMDVRSMLNYHIEKDADITISVIPIPTNEAHRFGIMRVRDDGRIIDFREKPDKLEEDFIKGGMVYASMGNYIMKREVLEEILIKDSENEKSSHDFGRDIIPNAITEYRVFAYDFSTNRIQGEKKPYWRDVGTIKAYFEAHMDLLTPTPELNLFNPHWPIRTVSYKDPPALITSSGREKSYVNRSFISEGSRIYGAKVIRSVLGRNVVVHEKARVEECILMDGVEVWEGAQLRRVIVDKRIWIPPGERIGFSKEKDLEKFFVDRESGIVVIPGEPPALRLEEKKGDIQ